MKELLEHLRVSIEFNILRSEGGEYVKFLKMRDQYKELCDVVKRDYKTKKQQQLF